MGQIIYSSTEPRFPDTRKVTRDKILQAIIAGAGGSGGSGSNVVFRETFEGAVGAGYDNVWTVNAGTPNPNYATAPAPLAGAHSLLLDASGAVRQMITSGAVGGGTIADFWVYFLWVPVTIVSGASFFVIQTPTNNLTAQVFTGGFIRALPDTGSTSGLTVAGVTAGQAYHVWMRYKPGNGGPNGTNSIAFSPLAVPVQPISGTQFAQSAISALTVAPANGLRVAQFEGSNMTSIYDNIIVLSASPNGVPV